MKNYLISITIKAESPNEAILKLAEMIDQNLDISTIFDVTEERENDNV